MNNNIIFFPWAALFGMQIAGTVEIFCDSWQSLIKTGSSSLSLNVTNLILSLPNSYVAYGPTIGKCLSVNWGKLSSSSLFCEDFYFRIILFNKISNNSKITLHNLLFWCFGFSLVYGNCSQHLIICEKIYLFDFAVRELKKIEPGIAWSPENEIDSDT